MNERFVVSSPRKDGIFLGGVVGGGGGNKRKRREA